MTFALAALLALCAQTAAPFAWPTPMPTTAPAPAPTVLWQSAPAASFALAVEPLGLTPDGDAQALVRVVLRDASGAVVKLRRGADFDYFVDRGSAQWQTRLRYGGPAAIVSVRSPGPVAVRVVANRPAALGTQRIAFDTRAWALPGAVAGAIGPHLVRVGWFPRVADGPVRVYRVGAAGQARLAATIAAPSSSWDDATVRPGSRARYVVVTPHARTAAQTDVPAELPLTSVSVIRGKSAWLAFSADPLDDASFARLDVDAIVATALRAGLRSIELRLAYGAFDESAPAAKATIDRLIDGLVSHGIAVIGWTVPRADAFDDLAENAAVAAYRTPRGNRISGLAIDLERGEEFLGDGPAGYAALQSYLAVVRRAAGPHVLLIATIEDPYLEHLDQTKYPYREIARDADVLQPMTYWRMMGPWDTAERARAAVAGSVALVRRLAERDVPIDVGAQTGVLGKRGAPPADEIAAAVAAARAAGAIGVAFYDYPGTGPEQWSAVAAAQW
ncbi:MAG TPA: hypothetical protein VHT05_01010 [Candidatus Elarobacter sp.]|nr:hypothetical protein [Candidatus Elarobacter sp.]